MLDRGEPGILCDIVGVFASERAREGLDPAGLGEQTVDGCHEGLRHSYAGNAARATNDELFEGARLAQHLPAGWLRGAGACGYGSPGDALRWSAVALAVGCA